ncbi:uncharacterized protein (DUF58 family) [Dyella sp. SG562]|uniref:DUF58 domain-containing protein n=1 Tax=Dyella TaxID=231454 RepID=UPI00141E65A1|nr:uncharacterized protein (DUF58 family) [Dyella sp. SG562]NKJ21270.1 uncharacterized protein (DUF58 family) [Dyella sp. SG609]
MSAVLPPAADGDGRASVALAELLALRARAARKPLSPRRSRATPSGPQASRVHGRGMDYAESRAYQPGDDIRRLDWRLTARSGKLHTKLFQEEREGRLLVLLDTHGSMRFGTRARFKSVQAARAAALAGWLAARAGERVGALAFGERRHLLRPQGSTRGALALCGALAAWDAERSTAAAAEPLSEALMRAGRLMHGASRVLLISDGLSADEAAKGRLIDLARHTDVSVLIVGDALELASAPPGRYPLEHGGLRREVVLFGDRQRRDFQQALGAGQMKLAALARSLGLPHRVIDTVADPLDPVAALLAGAKAGA